LRATGSAACTIPSGRAASIFCKDRADFIEAALGCGRDAALPGRNLASDVNLVKAFSLPERVVPNPVHLATRVGAAIADGKHQQGRVLPSPACDLNESTQHFQPSPHRAKTGEARQEEQGRRGSRGRRQEEGFILPVIHAVSDDLPAVVYGFCFI
jgi:hypothetical protein